MNVTSRIEYAFTADIDSDIKHDFFLPEEKHGNVNFIWKKDETS